MEEVLGVRRSHGPEAKRLSYKLAPTAHSPRSERVIAQGRSTVCSPAVAMLARFRDGALERQDKRAGIVAWTGCPPACLGCAGPGRVREAWPGGVSACSEKQAFFAPSLGVRTCHRPRKRQRVYLCVVNVCKLWCLCAGEARQESRHSRTEDFVFLLGGGSALGL